METQTRLSRHNKFISAENIVGMNIPTIFSPEINIVGMNIVGMNKYCWYKYCWYEYTNNILRRNKFIMTA